MSACVDRVCFVVPPFTGPLTGGTLYNERLCSALARRCSGVMVCAIDGPELEIQLKTCPTVWVDSLYLGALPELKRLCHGKLGLLAHYLPTLVSLGRVPQFCELGTDEQRALQIADAYCVTSEFMREVFTALVAPQTPLLVVAPGCSARLPLEPPAGSPGVRALLIANLTAGKGVAALLHELARAVLASDVFELSIVGSLDLDRDYALRCRSLLNASRELGARVELLGALGHAETMARLAGSSLLLSASLMESYGMALSEARVMGVPILACAGGNVREHVVDVAGGQLVADPRELARAFLELCRNPASVLARIAQARAHAPRARTWDEAAQEFLDQARRVE